MLILKKLPIPEYHEVLELRDSNSHLHGFIAIHDCTLGPALGGVRMYPYSSPEDALQDALQLAKCMTYKSALAGLGLGGGKSVIIGDPHKDKSEGLWLAFGEAIDKLHGKYIVAEDMGSSPEDMLIIRRKTLYVAALPIAHSSGDPSRFTAWGVFRGMQAVAKKLWGNPSLKSKKIAIQGVGHVGGRLAEILFWEGAELIVADTDLPLTEHFADVFHVTVVPPEKIHQTKCHIFSPCARGGVITPSTIFELQCEAIAGSANNPLTDHALGQQLMSQKILYAPDYVINAGGVINAATEFHADGYDPRIARNKTDQIFDILLSIFEQSEKTHTPTSQVADELAENNLRNKVGIRTAPLHFDREGLMDVVDESGLCGQGWT